MQPYYLSQRQEMIPPTRQLGRTVIVSFFLVYLSIFSLNRGFAQTTVQKGPNKNIIRELKVLYEKDQNLRLQLVQIEQNWNKDSKALSDTLWVHQKRLDSLNLVTLGKMKQAYSWDALMRLDDTSKNTIFLIIQHADSMSQVKYLPLIFRAVKRGHLPPQDFALLKDRMELRRSGKQYYGTQFHWDETKKKFVFFPFKYSKRKVSRQRKKLGMGSLEKYLKYINTENTD